MKYKFIGNENDPLTKKWGLKEGSVYEIDFPGAYSYMNKSLPTRIHAPIGLVICPYSSVKSFKRNWEKI